MRPSTEEIKRKVAPRRVIEYVDLEAPPRPEEVIQQTFCGT